MIECPLYSPDLAQYNFFLFPKFKFALKGTCFETKDEVKVKATQVIKKLSENDLQHLKGILRGDNTPIV